MAAHSSTLAWKIPWTEEPGRLQSMGLLRVRYDWATLLSLSCIGEGNVNPLQYSCLENPKDGGAWGTAVSGVAQSRTRLKRLSSSRKITADGECSHEVRCLLLARKVMINILKSRDITLPTKVHLVKARVFSSSYVWMGELDYKESWALKNWCFWTVGLEKTLESPLDCKEIQPVYNKGNQS